MINVPADGAKVAIENGKLQVPDNPILPFIEGDGTGRDIWKASVKVFDAAVEKAYGGQRKVEWMEVYAGEKAYDMFGEWLPSETIDAFKEYLVGIKGPLTTPIGGGIRSLNVALRKLLDLYVCQRPVQYVEGVPSPVKHPEYVDMVIFRENTEDIYTGAEFEQGTPENKEFLEVLKEKFPEQYEQFAADHADRSCRRIQKGGGIVFYHGCEKSIPHLRIMSDLSFDTINIGEGIDIGEVKASLGNKKCVMGNLDTINVLKSKSAEEVETATREIIQRGRVNGGYIFCTGEGIPGETPPQNVKSMVEAVRRYGKY